MNNYPRKNLKKRGGGVGYVKINPNIDITEKEVLEDDLQIIYISQMELYLIILYQEVDSGNDERQRNKRKLEEIHKFIESNKYNKICIIGDLNAHIGILGENVDRAGEELMNFCEANELLILNLSHKTEGEVTWSRGSLNQQSAIDYFLCNYKAEETIESMFIDEDGTLEIGSDHNTIIVTMKTRKYYKPDIKEEFLTNWNINGADWVNFQGEINEMSIDKNLNTLDFSEKLNKGILEAAHKNIGKKRVKDRSYTKTWWNQEIKRGIQSRREKNKIHRELQRKKAKGDIIADEQISRAWNEYQEAKKLVQKEVNQARITDEKEQIKKITEAERSKRNKKAWQYIKYTLGKDKKEQIKFLKRESDDAEVVGEEACLEIINYYKNIFQKNNESIDDVSFNIKSCINEENICYEFQLEEVENYIKKLKNGKSVGDDDIKNEFLKNGGANMAELLAELFNKIVEEEDIPNDWNKTKVRLVYKGQRKNKFKISSYRPISLTSNIYKVFCGILKDRFVKVIEENNILSDLQNGFRRGRRAADNIAILKTLMDRAKLEKRKLILVFLDIEKAYDRVIREILWKIIKKVLKNEKSVRILQKLYKNNSMYFVLGEWITEEISVDVGVRQGCILSSILYELYGEELISCLVNSGLGVWLSRELCIPCLGYADDTVITAEEVSEMQEMLNKIMESAQKLQMKFSTKKCKVLIINGDGKEELFLGDEKLEIVEEVKYLGIQIDIKDGKVMEGHKRNISLESKKLCHIIKNAAAQRCDKYMVGRELWKGFAVPKLMYCAETLGYKSSEWDKIEKAQNDLARYILGAPVYTATEALRGEMGWSSFKERDEKGILKYGGRIELMEEARMVRKVIKNRQGWKGLGKDFQFKRVMSGEQILLTKPLIGPMKWNKEVDRISKEKALRNWKDGCNKKTTLKFYKEKKCPSAENIYDGSWGSNLLFQARAGAMRTARRERFWKGGDGSCQVCREGKLEDEVHIISECKGYSLEREELKSAIGQETGVEDLNNEEFFKVAVGLPTLSDEIVKHTKVFLCRVFKKREEILDN